MKEFQSCNSVFSFKTWKRQFETVMKVNSKGLKYSECNLIYIITIQNTYSCLKTKQNFEIYKNVKKLQCTMIKIPKKFY